jgi:hypothetical protein
MSLGFYFLEICRFFAKKIWGFIEEDEKMSFN